MIFIVRIFSVLIVFQSVLERYIIKIGWLNDSVFSDVKDEGKAKLFRTGYREPIRKQLFIDLEVKLHIKL